MGSPPSRIVPRAGAPPGIGRRHGDTSTGQRPRLPRKPGQPRQPCCRLRRAGWRTDPPPGAALSTPYASRRRQLVQRVNWLGPTRSPALASDDGPRPASGGATLTARSQHLRIGPTGRGSRPGPAVPSPSDAGPGRARRRCTPRHLTPAVLSGKTPGGNEQADAPKRRASNYVHTCHGTGSGLAVLLTAVGGCGWLRGLTAVKEAGVIPARSRRCNRGRRS